MTDTTKEPDQAGRGKAPGLTLGIDTCGQTGSVALAQDCEGSLEILGQKELEGQSYSATLVSAVGELLSRSSAKLGQVGTIVIVNGPGSFTGVRVGVSAAKGLAEGRAIGVVPVSRLAVLAAKAGVEWAALDAHRNEVYLRVPGSGQAGEELLAGKDELAALNPFPKRIAVCDDEAAALLRTAWPGVELVRTQAPTAADAMRLCAQAEAGGNTVDAAMLDGHYLRRSDAEIFGEPGGQAKRPLIRESYLIRPMRFSDVDRVFEIAQSLSNTPHWPRAAYVTALDPVAMPRRLALVAAEACSDMPVGYAIAGLVTPGAEIETLAVAADRQRRGLARGLLLRLFDVLQKDLIEEVWLEVRVSNKAAIALYQRAGFVENGVRKDYYADPVEDATVMMLTLAKKN